MVRLPIYILLVSVFCRGCLSREHNLLNGRHLRTVWTLWRKENATGVFGPRAVIHIIEYLSKRFNFTYSMVENVTETTVERPAGAGRRGLVDYLIDGSCDILAHDITNNPSRQAVMDLTLPWIYAETWLLIPIPDSSANVAAVLHPFQWPVWVSLVASILIVVSIIFALDYLFDKFVPEKSISHFEPGRGLNSQRKDTTLYIFGVLLSQGGPCLWRALSIRLVAAVWCLAAFVLVNGYCSTLITYVISHYNPPLIESVHDIVRDPTINLVVEKVQQDPSIQNPIFTKLRERLASNPVKSRCYGIDDCFSRVKNGYRNVFVQASLYLVDGIVRDFEQTGKCHVQIAKKPFLSLAVSFGLKKHSPFTTTISMGMVETFEYGLNVYWQSLVRRMPTAARACWKYSEKENIKTNANSGDPDKLTLYNLTGAFAILAIGCTASLIAFLTEVATHRLSMEKIHQIFIL